MLEIRKVVVGPYQVNCYVLVDAETMESAIVDPGDDTDKVWQAARDTKVKFILITHSHSDHIQAVPEIRTLTRAALAVHPLDAVPLEDFVDLELTDGSPLVLGNLELTVLHIPGHTPGSVAFLYGQDLIVGDTLFPGGPGRTSSPANFQRELQSIRERLLALPDETRVHPGHGDATTVGAERPAIEAFLRRRGYESLCGDVTWQA